jgi:hypothetical protein
VVGSGGGAAGFAGVCVVGGVVGFCVVAGGGVVCAPACARSALPVRSTAAVVKIERVIRVAPSK